MLSLIFVGLLASQSLAEQSPDQELINKGLKFAAECAAKGNIKYDVCLEMFKEGAKLDDAKYDGCKCMIPCVSKKLNIMSEDEIFDLPAIEGYIENLKTPEWKEESKRVYPMCKDKTSGSNGCERGFSIFTCAMNNSEKAKAMAMKFVKMLSG